MSDMYGAFDRYLDVHGAFCSEVGECRSSFGQEVEPRSERCDRVAKHRRPSRDAEVVAKEKLAKQPCLRICSERILIQPDMRSTADRIVLRKAALIRAVDSKTVMRALRRHSLRAALSYEVPDLLQNLPADCTDVPVAMIVESVQGYTVAFRWAMGQEEALRQRIGEPDLKESFDFYAVRI